MEFTPMVARILSEPDDLLVQKFYDRTTAIYCAKVFQIDMTQCTIGIRYFLRAEEYDDEV